MTDTPLTIELERLQDDGYTAAEAGKILAATALLNRCFSSSTEPETDRDSQAGLTVMGGFAVAQRSELALPPADLDLIAAIPASEQLEFIRAKASRDSGDGLRITVTPAPVFQDRYRGIYPQRFVTSYEAVAVGHEMLAKLRLDIRSRPGGSAAETLPVKNRLLGGDLTGNVDWRLCTAESQVADLVAASLDRHPPSQRYEDAYRLMLLSNLPLDGDAFAAALAREFDTRRIPKANRTTFAFPADPRFKEAYRRQVYRAASRLGDPGLLDDLPTYPVALHRIGRLANPALRGEPLGQWESWEVGSAASHGHWSDNPVSRASATEAPKLSPAIPRGEHEPHLDQVAQLAQAVTKSAGGGGRTAPRRTPRSVDPSSRARRFR